MASRARDAVKLLFVCSRNFRRSLTAEHWLRGVPGYAVRSVGTQPGARVVVTAGHLGWADVVFVMEQSHLARLRRKFPQALEGKRVVNLLIGDDYEYMQPELLEELRGKLAPHLELPEDH